MLMSLNTREQQALLAIEDGLSAGDPKLASMLASFTRLTLDQEMPVHEKRPADVVTPGARRPRGDQQCPPRRRQFRRAGNLHKGLGWQTTGLLLSLLAVPGLIAMSLAGLGRSLPPCSDTWAVLCTGGVPAHTSPPPMRRMGPGHSGSSARQPRPRNLSPVSTAARPHDASLAGCADRYPSETLAAHSAAAPATASGPGQPSAGPGAEQGSSHPTGVPGAAVQLLSRSASTAASLMPACLVAVISVRFSCSARSRRCWRASARSGSSSSAR